MLTLALLSSAALAQEAPPIVNGSTTSDFIQVGTLVAMSNNGGAPFCSGTLIHPSWVLTAAHCLDAGIDYQRSGYDVMFMVGTSVYSNGDIEDYAVGDELIKHPRYDAQNLRNDIGLMSLETPLEDFDPIRLNDDDPGNSWVGTNIDYVGWGITSDNANDSGRKRHASIPYYDSDDYIIYAYDTRSNLCSGDSGGAGLLAQDDGSYLIAGVNSFVYAVQGNTSCDGGGSGSSRVDNQIDWIAEYVPLDELDEAEEVEPLDLDDTGEGPTRPMDQEDAGKMCGTGPASGGFAVVLLAGLGLVRRRRS